MKRFTILAVFLLIIVNVFSLFPPRNLTGEGGDGHIDLFWDPPTVGGMIEVSLHNGTAANSFYQEFDLGYGSVFNLQEYDSVVLEKIDFHHTNYDGLTEDFSYTIHVIDWDSNSSISIITGNVASQTGGWEEDIDLGAITTSGNIGIFIEPLSNEANNAYPVVDCDDFMNSESYVINISDYSIHPSDEAGDFLIDLWVTVDGGTMRKIPSRGRPKLKSNSQRNSVVAKLREFSGIRNVSRDLLGYKVYRNGVALFDNPLNNLEYTDDTITNLEDYDYYVTAIYDEGESDASNTVTLHGVNEADVLIEEGFESGLIPGNWVTYDTDEDGHDWTIGSMSSGGIVPHSGTYCIWSASWDQLALNPNNFLVTDAVEVNGDLRLTYWIAPHNQTYPGDHYKVLISTTGNDPGDFTGNILFEETLDAGEWEERTIDIDGYDNQTIHLAWQHVNSYDMFKIKLDDIKLVLVNVDNDDDVIKPNLSLEHSPNPFVLSNNSRANQLNISFEIPEVSHVELDIYNIKGEKVKSLVNETQKAGKHSVNWNGNATNNKQVGSGIYFYQLKSKNINKTGKILIVK